MKASPSLGLIAPLNEGISATLPTPLQQMNKLKALADEGVIDSLWVRDLPAVDVGDTDQDQGSDPWWYLGAANAYGVKPSCMGTASIILGSRHPLVIARAAFAAQADTDNRFVLGVGTGGKPALDAALGIGTRDYSTFAEQWISLRQSLLGEFDSGVQTHTSQPVRPPPVYLATSDLQRWRAIHGDADGWQTFLTDNYSLFVRQHEQICTLRNADTPVMLRLDVDLVKDDSITEPLFTLAKRGRIRCNREQLQSVLTPWLAPPIRHVMLRLTGYQTEQTLRHLSAWWRANVTSHSTHDF